MGRIGRGWQLVKLSLGILRKDKEILVFPVLEAVFTLLLLASFVVGMFLTIDFDADTLAFPWLGVVFMVLFYFAAYFLSVFFGAAVVGCATIRLSGGNPTVRDGLRIAGENVGRILAWTLLAATVGMIISALQQRLGTIGKIIMGAVGVAWTLITYFAVPVLIYEKLGPWATVKRSASLFKSTWGETIVGGLGMGAIFVLLGLAGILFVVAGYFLGGLLGLAVGAIIAFIYWVGLAIVASAAKSILVAALYRYAMTGQISEGYEQAHLANPWAAS